METQWPYSCVVNNKATFQSHNRRGKRYNVLNIGQNKFEIIFITFIARTNIH